MSEGSVVPIRNRIDSEVQSLAHPSSRRRFFAGLGGRRLGAEEALAELEAMGLLPEAARVRAESYSKGMRQKVGLAIALSRGATGLLLDEPLSGLDPQAANELVAKLAGLRERNCAVLMATHDLFRARSLADRVGVMREGQLMEILDPRDLHAEALEAIYLRHMSVTS